MLNNPISRKKKLGYLVGAATLVISISSNLGINKSFSDSISAFEAREDIKRLYEQAIRGEDYDAALEGLVAYAERGDISPGEQAQAFKRLEDLAAPELKDYLLGVAQGEIEFDNSVKLRGYAYRAYWAVLLAEAQDEADEERILLEGLQATARVRVEDRDPPFKTVRSGLVRVWAAKELCGRGKTEHLEEIRRTFANYAGGSTERLVDLCRRQMELVNRFDSRLETMEYILQKIDPEQEAPLINWALEDLVGSRSSEADQLVVDYILRLQNNPETKSKTELFIWPVILLRERNWTDADFEARGIAPMHF
jgi:hypothetical protein